MNRLAIATLLISVLVSGKAFAGSANANLNCSGNGTTIKGSVPGDYAEFDVNVAKGAKSLRLYSLTNQTGQLEGNGSVNVVQDLEIGVYTMSLSLTDPKILGFVQFYAIPKTVSYTRTRNGYVTTFSAKLSYNLSDLATDTQNETVKCSMGYSI